MKTYQVVVGNIGTVYVGDNKHLAIRIFDDYKTRSKSKHGRAAGEDVALLESNEIIKEHNGEDQDE